MFDSERRLSSARRAAMILSACVCAAGCAHRVDMNPATNQVVAESSLAFGVAWVKYKGDKLDAELVFENLTDQFLVIPLSDVRAGASGDYADCTPLLQAFGSATNMQSLAMFAGERLTLAPNARDRRLWSCRATQPVDEPARFVIKNVYRKGDASSLIRLAQDVEWNAPAR